MGGPWVDGWVVMGGWVVARCLVSARVCYGTRGDLEGPLASPQGQAKGPLASSQGPREFFSLAEVRTGSIVISAEALAASGGAPGSPGRRQEWPLVLPVEEVEWTPASQAMQIAKRRRRGVEGGEGLGFRDCRRF